MTVSVNKHLGQDLQVTVKASRLYTYKSNLQLIKEMGNISSIKFRKRKKKTQPRNETCFNEIHRYLFRFFSYIFLLYYFLFYFWNLAIGCQDFIQDFCLEGGGRTKNYKKKKIICLYAFLLLFYESVKAFEAGQTQCARPPLQ